MRKGARRVNRHRQTLPPFGSVAPDPKRALWPKLLLKGWQDETCNRTAQFPDDDVPL